MKIREHYLFFSLIIILILGCFLRFYNFEKNVNFGWDQETTAIKVLEMIRNKKPLLIGPRVGPAKFFLGPLYYYLVAPFLLVVKFNPIGLYYCSALIGILTSILIYFLGSKIFNKKVGFLSVIIYCFSPILVYFDRVPWNVNLIIMSSLLTFFAILEIFVIERESFFNYLLLGLGIGLGIQAHLTFIFFFGILLFFILIKRKFSLKIGLSFLIIFLSFLPLIVFDLRHDFFNSRAIVEFLNDNSIYPTSFSFSQRIIKNFNISLELVGKLFIDNDYYWIKLFPGVALLIVLLQEIFFFRKQKKEKYLAMLIYLFLPVFMLSFYKGKVPEYYLFFQIPIFILLIAGLLVEKVKILSNLKVLVLVFAFSFFLFIQNFSLINQTNTKSLFYKQQAANFILRKAKDRDFRINYLMNKGDDVGFNYFFKLRNRQISKNSDLEFLVTYPFSNEIRKKDYTPFGEFGISIKESSFDELFIDYFNREYLFAFDLPKNLIVIDCGFSGPLRGFTIVDKEKGSCSDSFLKEESEVRFFIGEAQKLIKLYDDFDSSESKFSNKYGQLIQVKKKKIDLNKKQKSAFFIQVKDGKGMFFDFYTEEQGGDIDKQLEQIINSLRIYSS